MCHSENSPWDTMHQRPDMVVPRNPGVYLPFLFTASKDHRKGKAREQP